MAFRRRGRARGRRRSFSRGRRRVTRGRRRRHSPRLRSQIGFRM